MKLRIISIVLCLALLLSVSALADVMGEPIDGCSAVLAEGVVLTEQNYWTGKDLRGEHYLTLAPDSAARPAVVSSARLWAQQRLDAAAVAMEQQGMHVLAGSNGGFYTIATGEPVGLVISGGVLRADDAGLEAVGFRADGSVIFGKPEMRMQLRSEEQSLPIAALNRTAGAGLRLYTADCTEKITPAGESFCVFCDADSSLQPGGSVTLTVRSVTETDEPVSLPEGQMLLLLEKNASGEPAALPSMLREGAELTLEIGCADGWEDVDSAVGILYPLLRDGEIVDGLQSAAAPRTAVGVKADGSIVLYTVDGRQSGYSVGAGLTDVARRLQELGCVTAGALDGGGSTRMAAQMPGDSSLSTVNRPSENRNVVNYILIGVPAASPSRAVRLTLYPLHINALSGAEIPLTVKATDQNGYPVSVPQGITYSVSGGIGSVKDRIFYAKGTGSGTVTVSAPGLVSVEIPVRVTESPEKLELYGEVYGKKTTSLTLEPGQEVDLTVRATDRHVLLTGDDCLYSWELEPAAGTVDETGHIIPGDATDTGLLTVRAGDSVVEIPISVWTGVPFRDVSVRDERFSAVKYVYENKIFQGVSETEFAPDTVMSRAMLVTVLWRMCGQPEASAAAGFADVAADNWYGPAVAWAAETGLVNGYSAEWFAPDDDLTREQILTILHRWAGLPAPDETIETDVEDTDDYAVTAMKWAIQNGLVTPEPEAGLQPRAPMVRAGVAEVLQRWSLLASEEAEENYGNS